MRPKVTSIVPNFTFIGPYFGVSVPKNCKVCFPCSIVVKFMWFMQGSLLYKCFTFGAFPIINEVFSGKHCNGSNSPNFWSPLVPKLLFRCSIPVSSITNRQISKCDFSLIYSDGDCIASQGRHFGLSEMWHVRRELGYLHSQQILLYWVDVGSVSGLKKISTETVKCQHLWVSLPKQPI